MRQRVCGETLSPSPKILGRARQTLRIGAGSLVVIALSISSTAQANPTPAPVTVNGGLTFESQSSGTPNSFSGYLFAPLSQGRKGQVLFLDLSAKLNLGDSLAQQSDTSVGGSTRLGYRWLSGDQRWLYGLNAGVDTRQAYSDYAVQIGIGAEALSRNLELRANGYIPIANQTDAYATGFANAALRSNLLILDGWNRYIVSLGGINLEAGLPAARWNGGSLWLYTSYYYLNGPYLASSSGVSGRAELRLGPELSLGARLAYDDIFSLQASGYVRYGSRPLKTGPGEAITNAERDFLALRGLPMQREGDIRMAIALQALPGTVAVNPLSGGAWIVRCTGTTVKTLSGSAQCVDTSLRSLLASSSSNEVLLVGGDATADLAGAPSDGQGRPTLNLPAGTTLAAAAKAPTLLTQFGNANLASIFGPAIGSQPSIRNGVLQISSNSTIAGLNFSNASLTSYNSSNLVITGNSFIGSYSDNPTNLATAQAFGPINVSAKALPAIQLEGIQRLRIAENSFVYPQVQTYASQRGIDGTNVCSQPLFKGQSITNKGLCLSANAIRLNNTADTWIDQNSVIGALDEAFRINNPTGLLVINNNSITGMRMGPDSNIGSAIIVGQSQGSSTVAITNNRISNNTRGVYGVVDSANQSGVPVLLVNPSQAAKNVADPIEIGLCRGSDSFPRSQDLYANPLFSGNCATQSAMTVAISGNRISLPSIANGSQDGDGIDLNIGASAQLQATINNNFIDTLGDPGKDIGDNGLTFDIRGNSRTTINILNNFINNAGDAAIGFSFQNTTFQGAPGFSQISITGTRLGLGFTNQQSKTVQADLVNNPGVPISVFRVFGQGVNELTNSNVQQQEFNKGPLPRLFVNNVQIQGQPPN